MRLWHVNEQISHNLPIKQTLGRYFFLIQDNFMTSSHYHFERSTNAVYTEQK